ncbi:MAG: hypothetical protein LC799_26445, partial [Actinobacteria bacterium]|nr:hypothetical protein [Actinomycetota bacterium]
MEQEDGLDSSAVDKALELAVAYHASARAEIIQRLGHRDTALALFVATVGVVSGVVLGGDEGLTDQSALALYLIPFVGLGATLIHVHHNGVIGALGVYLGVELHGEIHELLTSRAGGPASRISPPHDWDSSKTLRTTVRRPSQRRLVAGMLLLELPQVGALVIAGAELPFSVVSVTGFILGGLAA